MIKFDETPISSNISLFRAYVREQDHDIAGVLLNDYYDFRIDFFGVRQMFRFLDELFDYVNFPMAGMEQRTFEKDSKKPEKQFPAHVREIAQGPSVDGEADFILHVQFRQGSTWQGTLRWIGGGKTRRFRSERELIALIMKAIGLDPVK